MGPLIVLCGFNGFRFLFHAPNRLMSKKSTHGNPPILENGIFVTNVATKANILNNYLVQQFPEISTGSTIHSFLVEPLC